MNSSNKISKVTRQHPFLTVPLAVLSAFLTLLAGPAAFAATYYWDSDGATAGFGTAAGTWGTDTFWSTNSTGGASTIFIGTTSTNDTVNFGTPSLNYGNAGVAVVAGGVSVNKINFGAGQTTDLTLSGGTITLGGNSPSITVSNAGQIFSSPLTLNSNTTISAGINAATVLTLNGAISGSGNLTFSTVDATFGGVATGINLGGASDYSGTTRITVANTTSGHNNVMNIKATIANALPATTVLTLDGGIGAGSGRQVSYDLNGNNQTLAGLVNVTGLTARFQRILNSGGTCTLTISNTANYTFGGNINGTTFLSLTKKGTGTQTLSATNTYAGTTTISEGKLQGSVGGSIANSTVVLAATTATNGVSITDNTKGWTNAAFTASAAGVLEFDFGGVTPSLSVSPLNITGLANFTAATPKVRVLVNSGLLPGEYPLMTWGTTSGTAPTTADLTVSTVMGGTAASLSNSVTTLYLVIASTTSTIVKADNTTNLNLGTSWVGGVAPGPTGLAKWNSTVASPNTSDLGADMTWAGIAIENPNGPVTVNGVNTLTLGAAALNIDLSAATANLTLNCPLALGAANTWDVTAGRTLTVGGAISGANTLTLQNAGTNILSSGANSYSGNTTVSATSTLQLGAANVIPDGSGKGNVAIDGALDLNAFSEAINNLSGAGTVDTVAGGTPTLTVGANSAYASNSFSGVIQNTAGSLSLTKTGTNLVALSGINTFSGAVQLNEGYLAVGSVSAVTDVLPNVTGITISNGATLGAWTNTTLTAPITVASGGTAAIAAVINGSGGTTARDFSLQGGISGNGNVIFKGVNNANGYGHIVVANCTYTGSTLITCSDELLPSFFSSVQTNNNEIMVRLAGDNGLPTTTVLTLDGGNGIGTGVGRYCDLSLSGWNQTLAGLTNVPGRNLRVQRVVNADTAAAGTLTVNSGADCTFSGFLGGTGGALGGSNPGNNLSLVKSGSGTFTIAKTDGNTYANGTTVNGGLLLVNNTTGSGTGAGDVTINSGGTLGGTGSIAGNVTVGSGGALAPGASIGTLNLNGNLVLDAASTNTFEVNGSTPANDEVVLGGTVTYGGVLKIVPSGSFTNGQTFTLFSGAGATEPSNFDSLIVSPAVNGTSFTFTNGILTAAVVSVGPSGPATLTNSLIGSTTLSLTWPAGQGWRLQQQTNSLAVGLFTNWTYITDGTISSTNLTIDATKPTVFYRLTYP